MTTSPEVLALLERLVIDDPMFREAYEGFNDCCVFCGHEPNSSSLIGDGPQLHKDDCPWIEAMNLLGRERTTMIRGKSYRTHSTLKEMAVKPVYVGTAYDIARDGHEGQEDKAGEPYVFHPIAVAKSVEHHGPEYEAAAVLHDVIEDTSFTADMLRVHGIPDEVIAAVEALTFLKGRETRAEYYERVKANEIALVVKLADIRHNSDPVRLHRLDPADAARLRTKYQKARAALS